MDKKKTRLKRALKVRSKIKQMNIVRLSVHKTARHIYAQIISADGARTLVSASTNQSGIKDGIENTGNVDAAIVVGKTIARKAMDAGITQVAFDRSGFQYHGRVKALADAAREIGLIF